MYGMRWRAAAVLAAALAAGAENIGTDPAHPYAWGENVGWINTAPGGGAQTVTVHYYEGTGGWLSGYAWGENIGWIVMGNPGGGPYANTTADNWGVNLSADGRLSGYAWGENVGWINFSAAQCDAAINTATGEFSGHAWGENIGWLKFKGTSPDYGVRSMAFYTQPQGTPNWWLDYHGVTEDYDAGDGVPAWRKYVMDTNPKTAGDYLRLTAIAVNLKGTDVSFTPASTRRYYTLVRRAALTTGAWENVSGQVNVQFGTPGEKILRDKATASRMFYTVEVKVTP